MITLATVLTAILLDRILGEPRRWHPLVGFGTVANWIEQRLNRGGQGGGLCAWLLLVAPPTLATAWLVQIPLAGPLAGALLLWLAVGGRSLAEHAKAVDSALQCGDLDCARREVGKLVSRDTAQMDETAIARAATESVLENGNDAVFGALFWFLVLGAPGVVLYRLANTLDAMWGYRTVRYRRFGWAAARFDDLLNLIPARLTALSYALVSPPPHARRALTCWHRQAAQWESPNAGPVMASGAGALGLLLGGPTAYHGALRERPLLGCETSPAAGDIHRAVMLVRRATWLWLIVAALIAGGLSLGA